MRNEGIISGSAFCLSELPPGLPSVDRQTSTHQKKILIFSQEYDTRVLLKTLLELWGFEAEAADCLDKSLTIIDKQKPSLILLDSVLPFGTHLENIRQIRKNRFSKKTPIIVISGFSQRRFIKSTFEVGANEFLVKPLDFDFLEDILKKNTGRAPAEF